MLVNTHLELLVNAYSELLVNTYSEMLVNAYSNFLVNTYSELFILETVTKRKVLICLRLFQMESHCADLRKVTPDHCAHHRRGSILQSCSVSKRTKKTPFPRTLGKDTLENPMSDITALEGRLGQGSVEPCQGSYHVFTAVVDREPV